MATVALDDIRCILASPSTAIVGAVMAIISKIDSGAFSGASAVKALIEIGAGNVAAALFSILGERSVDVLLVDVQGATLSIEMALLQQNHGKDLPTSPRLRTSDVLHFSAFGEDGVPVVRYARPESIPPSTHLLLAQRWSAAGVSVVAGAAAYCTRRQFDERWHSFTRGLLDEWDWRNCIAAGGAVLHCLLHADAGCDSTERNQQEVGDTVRDVDLFFYGLTVGQLRYRSKQLERHVRRVVGADKYAVLVSRKAITIAVEGAPRLKLTRGLWKSVDDVLSTTDMDCCGVGYDRLNGVVITGRAAASLASRCNTATAERHRVQGSLNFELRLCKYAQRYGFAVLDPHNAATDDKLQTRRQELKVMFETTLRPNQRDDFATTLARLYWLMAVDAGYVKPLSLTFARSTLLSLQETLKSIQQEREAKLDSLE